MMRITKLASLFTALVLVAGNELSSDKQNNISETLPRLHAETGVRAGIYDEFNREVLLRGVNYTSLGDYYQAHPDLPAVVEPRPDDFARIASLGFNVVRMIVHWSLLEPTRGELNQAYIEKIREQVNAAA